MPKFEVNLIPNDKEAKKRKKKIIPWKKIVASLIIIVIIIMAVFSSSIAFSDESLIKSLTKFNFLGKVGQLIGSANREVYGENNDRINILIVGMGGKNHQGGTLADTIILASFKPSTKQVAMMSLPRDLSIPADGYGWIKINALHAYEEKKNPGEGAQSMINTLNKLFETDIHYFATVDFDGFEKIIDEFGGVDVYVERDLIDYQYPIRGKEYVYPIENRFEILKVEEGWHHMDGELALKYARSRHASGIEGSDFARARRQQKIITALKDKVFTVSTIFNPKHINSLLSAYREHINTNLEIWEMLRLAQMGKDVDISSVISQTLTDGPNGMLYAQIINGAYVLLPDDDDFQEIKSLWQNIFYSEGEEPLTKVEQENNNSIQNNNTPPEPEKTDDSDEQKLIEAKPTTDYKSENASIEIQNGTWTEGWAGSEKSKLEKIGFKNITAANADNHEHKEILIYDLSDGKYPETAKELAKTYGVIIKNTSSDINSNASFVIILGK